MTLMKFHPGTGKLLEEDHSRHASDWQPDDPDKERRLEDSWGWLYNPWTGQSRHFMDIQSDPYGRALVAPGEPLRAATKESNPKDAIGDKKVPLWLLSPIAKIAWAMAQFAGQIKYGSWNWRIAGVRASTYTSAIERHLDAFKSGETFDPTDGTDHLGNIMACCAILMDAREAGKLTDDRPPVVSHRAALARAEGQMEALRTQYAGKNPRHYTITDSVSRDTLTANLQGEIHVTVASTVSQCRPDTNGSWCEGRRPGAEEA